MSKLTFYATASSTPIIVPADHKREWMDNTQDQFSYRCLPLNIANAFGWEILCPFTFTASWDAGMLTKGLIIKPENPAFQFQDFVSSYFGYGVITFHLPYVVRTEKGWSTFVTGPVNSPKHGVIPLSGIVETEWLPFSFTMNWKMTQPGSIEFKEGEPICRVIPIPHDLLDNVTPEILPISANPELETDYKKWFELRETFLNKMRAGYKKEQDQGWQKDYFRGHTPWDPKNPHEEHKSKLRLKNPIDKR
jgi:hypothetical protein